MQIDRYDENGGTLLICAVRYALGRYSLLPKLVIGEIAPMLKDVSYSTLFVMRDDVEKYLKSCHDADEWEPMEYYKKEWAMFLRQIEAEMELRKDDER